MAMLLWQADPMSEIESEQLRVRRAGEADLPVWAGMLASLHDGLSAEEALRELRDLVELPEPYVGFLALDEEDRPVGVIDARVRNYAEGSPQLRAAYVEDLWVEPHHRRRGVARALLHAVEEWARAEGLKWLGSDTTLEKWPKRPLARGRRLPRGRADRRLRKAARLGP